MKAELKTQFKGVVEEFERGELSFGAPWRMSKKAASAVVPIIRQNQAKRGYVLLQEVQDKVLMKDMGQINRAVITNKSDSYVFVRKGSLLKGTTQERGVTVGVVVPPNSISEIEIQCVHASKGIISGSDYHYAGIAPREVEGAFMSNANQRETWSAVESSMKTYDRMVRNMQFGSRCVRTWRDDDLVAAMEQTAKFKDEVERVLEKVPVDLDGQVGIAIIDASGVAGVEFFDHPESWRAFSRSVVRNYAEELIGEKAELFELDDEKVEPTIMDFLEKLAEAREVQTITGDRSETRLLESPEVVGEYALLNGRIIHAIGTRTAKEVVEHHGIKVPQRGTDYG